MDWLWSYDCLFLTTFAIWYCHHCVSSPKPKKQTASSASSLPRIGLRNEIFSYIRANLREYTAGFRTIKDGYAKYNKHGRAFIIPDPSFQEQVMLPPSQLQWFSQQPDSMLSERVVKSKRFGFKYLAATLDYHNEEVVMAAIRKDFLRNLPKVQPDLFEDMKRSVDSLFGVDTNEWREVCVWKSMEHIILSSTNRLFFGPPLCENEEYLRFSGWFAFWLGFGGVVVGSLIPSIIRPIAGYLAAIPVYINRNKSLKYLVPVIAKRMDDLKAYRDGRAPGYVKPDNLITWIIEKLLDANDTSSPPPLIAEQLLFFTLGATHTTITTSTNALLDILSSPPSSRILPTLRDEASTVFTASEAWNSPTSLKNLPKLESAIRETLRLSPVITRVVMREVMAQKGVTLPDGLHLPKGTWAGATAIGVHGDESLYSNPSQYEPFRFVVGGPVTADSAREENGASKKVSFLPVEGEEKKEQRIQSIPTINENFLSFGLGKHACPGRWFVAAQMKLLLAYIIMSYDIQPLASRPTNLIFGDSFVPSQTAKIRVRRRA